jgi:ABC-type transport system involved in multi-copper enzyme maturation permease subunit
VPIHDLGYRAWQGRLMPEASRFWVIAQTGIRLAGKNRWLRRLLLLAWVPALYLGVAVFLFEQALANQSYMQVALEFVGPFPGTEVVREALQAGDPAVARHTAWTWLLLMFFRYPQGLLMALVVGLIAPPLVAKDVQSRAFLLYFSRPLTRVEYILGKLVVVWAYVMMITTLPALALYVVGVLLSPPDAAVIASTWDLPLRILGASVVLMIPTAALALAFSSLTSRTFYAGFAWFAVWLLGLVAYITLKYSALLPISEHWVLLSLYHTLGRVQDWVFGLQTSLWAVWPSAMLLAGIAVVSLAVLFRRVSSPMRI